MPESVDILVAATNQASPVFNRVGDDAERLGMRVKESGKRVKASTELVGTFANVLGNTQFGGVAGQLAQLTERVSAFSEMSKAGAAGALAFKLGLIGAAAVVTYKTTEIIASWWFELDKAKEKADEAAKSFAKMAQELEGVRNKKFAETREDLSLVYDPAERDRATKAEADRLEKLAKDMERQGGVLAKERAELEKLEKRAKDASVPFIERQQDRDVLNKKAQIEESEAYQATLLKEAAALRESIGARAKSVESQKAKNAAAAKSDAHIDSLRQELALTEAVTDAEKRKIMAGRDAPTRSNEAAAIQERIDLKKAEQSEQKRIEAAQDRELDRLELKRIEIEKGKEAARAYALEMEGMSEEFARNIAAREAALDAMTKSKPDNSPQMAVQGRLLTQGNAADPNAQVVKELKDTNKLLADMKKLEEERYQAQKDRGFTVKTVTVP